MLSSQLIQETACMGYSQNELSVYNQCRTEIIYPVCVTPESLQTPQSQPPQLQVAQASLHFWQ